MYSIGAHVSACGCLLLFTSKPCCLQTCNYDQSLVVTDTNTPTNFKFKYCFVFELCVSNDRKKKKNFAHHSPIDLRWRAWGGGGGGGGRGPSVY